MGTNKIVLRTAEEFLSDYVPVYQPIYPLFLGNSQQYAPEVGSLSFKRAEVVGDIRARKITPKDTVIQQVGSREGSKTFKKAFLATQFVQSTWQDRQGVEDVFRQVMDEMQKQMDDLLLLGEGTADNAVENNGLFWSGDSNHTTESSVEIASGSGRLADFHAKVIANATTADTLAGNKLIIFYGSNILPLYNGIYSDGTKPFKSVLSEVLGPNYSHMALPAAVTPSSSHGWMIVNRNLCKLNYTLLPGIHAQGVDERNNEVWANFAVGNCMLDVQALNAVIKQPATLAA